MATGKDNIVPGTKGDEPHGKKFIIRWHKISWGKCIARAFIKVEDKVVGTTTVRGSDIDIGCPLYEGKTKDDVVQKCRDYISNRGCQASNDEVKFNKTAIDFNVELSKAYWDNGNGYGQYYFKREGTRVYLVLSNMNGHPMFERKLETGVVGSTLQKHEMESLELEFGRYEVIPCASILGEQWFTINWVGEVEEGKPERLGTPGFTIAQPRRDHAGVVGTGVAGTPWQQMYGYHKVMKAVLDNPDPQASDLLICEAEERSQLIEVMQSYATKHHVGQLSVWMDKGDPTVIIVKKRSAVC